ncbi:MAG: hypothetical protein QXN75_03390 [Thermoproteota archaeon]|nr:hypothetical protein [Candidatus Brockarchaeota archaeon]
MIPLNRESQSVSIRSLIAAGAPSLRIEAHSLVLIFFTFISMRSRPINTVHREGSRNRSFKKYFYSTGLSVET